MTLSMLTWHASFQAADVVICVAATHALSRALQDWAALKGGGRSYTSLVIHVAATAADLWPSAVLLNNALCTVKRSPGTQGQALGQP